MTARHVYIDETKHRGYLVVAAFVPGDELAQARAVVQGLLKRGQQHLHMRHEADGRKKAIAGTLTKAGIRATVYDAGRGYRTQLDARAACLSALVRDLSDSDIETLMVLDQDETLVKQDRKVLYQAVREAGREATVRYAHRRAAEERLLGIPDAYAWCWAKGGHWRPLIEPAISVRTV